MVVYILTQEGDEYLEEGLPEVSLANLLSSGPVSIEEAKRKLENFSVAMLWAKKNGWVNIEDGILKQAAKPNNNLLDKLRAVKQGQKIDQESLDILLKRRLVREQRTTLDEQAEKLVGKEITNLSTELIATGKWREVKLKPYNVEANAKIIYPGKTHHYLAFLDWVKNRLASLGFEEMRGPIIETEFWNMDALYMPQFHSARDIHDAYFIKDPKYADKLNDKVVESVASAHEKGIAGSTGWGYKYNRDKSHRLILRTHDTAISARTLASGNVKVPGKYFQIVRCFRPDVIDASHLPDFFQLGGFVIDEDMNFRHLIGLLRMFAKEFAGTEKIKLVPGYFPFTEPSVELAAYHKDLGWLELAGAGVFRPEMTRALGIKAPVIAWGLGMDRIAMLNMGIKDIREMFSQDLDFIRKKEVVY